MSLLKYIAKYVINTIYDHMNSDDQVVNVRSVI